MHASGLNEGITEMLAMQVDNSNFPAAYDKQVYLAEILVNSQEDSLIKAYFTKDTKQFRDFLNEFDVRQSVITSNELVSLSTISDGIIDVDMLKGCLQYSLSFCQNMEQLTNERKRLLPVFQSMSKNIGIEFSDENFDLKEYFKEVMSAKRQEIQQKESETVILPTEIGKATVNAQTQMKDAAKEKVNQDIQIVANKEYKKEGEQL